MIDLKKLLNLEGAKALYDDLRERIGQRYMKPPGGIPAKDIAPGVIPEASDIAAEVASEVASEIIDDTARYGSTDKTWSADQLADQLDKKAKVIDTTLTTTLSRGRSDNSTVGQYSFAFGNNVTASGDGSHAEGSGTIASGYVSHVEGLGTIASGNYSHVSGKYNIADSLDNWNEWTASTDYNIGDKVKRTNGGIVTGYVCRVANSDASFKSSKWAEWGNILNYAEIVGNGTAANTRSNARALDWGGNEYLNGDIYVGCGTDSSGGTKLPRIPEASSTDGSYILQATIASGVPTYSWTPLSSLSGVTF